MGLFSNAHGIVALVKHISELYVYKGKHTWEVACKVALSDPCLPVFTYLCKSLYLCVDWA